MLDKVKHSDWVYDIETYYDLFSACFVHAKTGQRHIFEVSERVNQAHQFVCFIDELSELGHRLFGYNSVGFDWPVCDHLISLYRATGTFTAIDAHEKANAIINSDWGDWTHNVAPWKRLLPQGDLMKIHHFDNSARRTSLKKLEINMRSEKVIDLPYPPDQPTTSAQKDEIIAYMCHDVNETLKFFYYSVDRINFRDDLATKHDIGDILNFNDGKIGAQIMISQIEASGTPCYHKPNGKKEPRQTIRGQIRLADVISPKVFFRHPEFYRIATFIASKTILPSETKGFFGLFDTIVWNEGSKEQYVETVDKLTGEEKKLVKKAGGRRIVSSSGDGKTACLVDGFQYDFGTGGIHGSIHKSSVHEDDEWEIWDWDVASYYPNLAITHRWYPDHLSSVFTDVYHGTYLTRKKYPKPMPENLMYKFALNVPYGQSNSIHSPFFDPQYTMSVTINGQLLLCMLAEWLTHTFNEATNTLYSISDCVQMIQINTDGLTIRVKKSHVEWMHNVCKMWEEHTGLELESAQYKSMFVRDVNSYMAVKVDDKVKRIGAYRIETPLDNINTREFDWHQDQSALVVRKAVNAHLTGNRIPIADFILNHRDPYDFQCSVKVNRSANKHPCYLMHGDEEVQRNTRYYISTDGKPLNKRMVKRNATEYSNTGIDVGWTVTITNDMQNFRWDNVNWLWYIEEAKKLIEGLDYD